MSSEIQKDEPTFCVACGKIGISGCMAASGGTGTLIPVINNGDIRMRECPNVRTIRMRKFLHDIDPQMADSNLKHERKTPLYQQGTADLTNTNLWITQIPWEGFLAHLKWVAASKGLSWYCKVVSDRTLINIFVGNTSVKVRLHQSDDDDLITTNSIEDYLSGPDLVIIRLGLVIHTNKAGANVLSETIRMRKALGKPTWIVEPEDMSFTPHRADFGSGMVMCSDENYNFVSTHYSKITLRSNYIRKASLIDDSDDSNDSIDKFLASRAFEEKPRVAVLSETTTPKLRQKPPTPEIPSSDGLVLDVSAFSEPKKKKKSSWGRD